MPIQLPSGVTASFKSGVVEVKGPKGYLAQQLPQGITVTVKDGVVTVNRSDETKQQRSYHGLARSLVNNMVIGVTAGFQRILDVVGIGYKAEVKGNTLVLNLGFSHLIEYQIPEGIKIKVERQGKKVPNYVGSIIVEGIDKQKVGQVAAEIRSFRKPDAYKGKGVRYSDEVIHLKEGKKTA